MWERGRGLRLYFCFYRRWISYEKTAVSGVNPRPLFFSYVGWEKQNRRPVFQQPPGNVNN